MRTVLVVLALALTGPALGARTESPTDVATLASTAKSVVHVRVERARLLVDVDHNIKTRRQRLGRRARNNWLPHRRPGRPRRRRDAHDI